jgi:hypothetical protein
MSFQISKLVTGLVAAITLVALLSGGTLVYAHVDAAAKARATGDYSRWGNQSRSRSRVMRSYAPARSAETRQSFSYEPAEEVAKATGGCPQHAAAPKAAKQDIAAAPKSTRRSYSYEPSVQPEPRARSYNRSAAPKKDPWMYPKADPRRYNH